MCQRKSLHSRLALVKLLNVQPVGSPARQAPLPGHCAIRIKPGLYVPLQPIFQDLEHSLGRE